MDGLTKSVVLWRQPSIYDSPSSYPPGKCTNLKATANSSSVKLTWTDPENVAVHGGSTTIQWGKTVIVRKSGSAPTSVNDGTVVTTSTVRNQYQSTPYIDTITNGASYYYAAFSCSTEGVYNRESVYVLPSSYKTMTVQFEITQTPGYGIYADDATNMTYGKSSDAVTQWQEFFGYKPCLFKDGQVVGYLNPNDYTKFEDGTSADITSGNAGDVMVEFPRRGIKISKSGNIVTVSMTDNPNAEGYSYRAHTRGSTSKDYFYIGAYLGYNANSKLRSLSGKRPTSMVSLSNFRTFAGNLGTGYMEVGFYQFLFIQCMYLLQYKGHLNSQSVHGYGYCNASSVSDTGRSDAKGVMYGTASGSSSRNDHIKLFGIEDFWGNLSWFLDGYYVNSSYHILTATNGFNNTGSGYTDNGAAAGWSDIDGSYISNAVCSSEVGFTPLVCNGSSSTYFCDFGSFYSGFVPYVGGSYTYGITPVGVFFFNVGYSPTNTARDVCGRLGYL